MRMQIYNALVNKHCGIREKYHAYHDSASPKRRLWSYFLLIWLNVRYYVLRDRRLDLPEVAKMFEEKELPNNMTESRERVDNSKKLDEFVSELSKYDVISFDIFDTLIFRPFSDPTDVFYILGEKLEIMDFKRIRQEQEWFARKQKYKKSGHYEIGLEDIWTHIEKEIGVDAEQGMSLEKDTEEKFCYANPFMKLVYERIKEQEKTIVVTTDMYMPSAFLMKLLEKNGYTGITKMYVSCENECSKADGRLFELVKHDFPQKSIIHVGDNEKSDISMARQKGIPSVYYQNVNKHSKEIRAYDMSLLIGGAYRGIVNNHVYAGLEEYSAEYEYGYIYGGLFVVGYCSFIHDYCKKNNVSKLLFLSRDGDILKQVYDMLYLDEKTEYVYWSRKAATKLEFFYDRRDYFRRFLYHKVNQNIIVEEIMKSMELSELTGKLEGYQDKDESGNTTGIKLKESNILTEKNIETLKRYIIANADYAEQKYKKQLQAAEKYYRGILEGCKKVVTVDIGWAGSGAMALRYLTSRIWQIPCEIVGMIAGTNTVHNSEPDASETFLQSGKLVAYLYSQSHNRDLLKKHDPNKDYNVFWELLLSSPTPQFSGFQSGNACREKTEDRYFPDLDITLQFGKYDANQEGIKEIQHGILDFAADYKEHFKDFPYMFNISGRDAYAPMLVAASHNEKYLKAIEKKFDLEINVN